MSDAGAAEEISGTVPVHAASGADHAAKRRPPQWGVIAQFLGMGLVWGASFLFMKVALGGVSFGQVAWSRIILGAIVLGVIVAAKRSRLPKEGVVWAHLLVVAIANCVIPFLLFAWAEQYVASSLASIYNAVTPVTTAIMAAALFRVERLTSAQVFGIAVGLLGVVVIAAPWRLADPSAGWQGQLACLGAVSCYGFALGYTRRFLSRRDLPSLSIAFCTVSLAAAVMVVLTPLVAWHPVRLDLPIVLSLLVLGGLGTGLAFLWNMNVLRAWGPTSSSSVTYITPVVGVALGMLVLGETLSWNEPLGAAVVFVGILYTQQRLRFRGRAPRIETRV